MSFTIESSRHTRRPSDRRQSERLRTMDSRERKGIALAAASSGGTHETKRLDGGDGGVPGNRWCVGSEWLIGDKRKQRHDHGHRVLAARYAVGREHGDRP